MDGITEFVGISKKIFDFFSKRINLDAIFEKLISIIFISIIMYFSIRIGNKIINKFVDRQVASKTSFSLEPQKALTIGEVLKSVLKYTVYIIGIGSMLYDILAKIPVALVSAGGFAIGLGAQSIGIRTTVLRDFTGDLHLIPNGSVLEVTNHSRGDIRFIVDVEIAYEENVDTAIEVIKKTSDLFEEKHKDKLRSKVDVLGVLSLNASGVTIRVVGRAEPLSQWEMERELRKDIKIALDEAGIEIPYPKTTIINKNNI